MVCGWRWSTSQCMSQLQFGCTALIWAARDARSECARLLVEAGANTNAVDVVRHISVSCDGDVGWSIFLHMQSLLVCFWHSRRILCKMSWLCCPYWSILIFLHIIVPMTTVRVLFWFVCAWSRCIAFCIWMATKAVEFVCWYFLRVTIFFLWLSNWGRCWRLRVIVVCCDGMMLRAYSKHRTEKRRWCVPHRTASLNAFVCLQKMGRTRIRATMCVALHVKSSIKAWSAANKNRNSIQLTYTASAACFEPRYDGDFVLCLCI